MQYSAEYDVTVGNKSIRFVVRGPHLAPLLDALNTLRVMVQTCCMLPCSAMPRLMPVWTLTLRNGISVIQLEGATHMNISEDAGPMSASVRWKTKHGFDASVDGATKFESSDPNLLMVSEDGSQVEVGPLDGVTVGDDGVTLGTGTLTATADADLGDGVVPVVALLAFVITKGGAQVGELSLTPQ